MNYNKHLFKRLAFGIATLTLLLNTACESKNTDSKVIGEQRVDSSASDTALQNVNLEMEKDNTIAKDSAAHREDLGGGSQ